MDQNPRACDTRYAQHLAINSGIVVDLVSARFLNLPRAHGNAQDTRYVGWCATSSRSSCTRMHECSREASIVLLKDPVRASPPGTAVRGSTICLRWEGGVPRTAVVMKMTAP